MTQVARWLSLSGPTPVDIPATPEAWVELKTLAVRAGLAGLLLEATGAHQVEVPGDIAGRLRAAVMAVAANNIHLQTELGGIVRAFNRANVPVMLLKGAALNLSVYARPDLRPMSDLDLLIHPGTADATLRLLAEHGCRRGFDLVREDFFPRYHYELELFSGSVRPARIDLHARPLRPLRVSRTMPDNALWQNAQLIHVDGGEASIPRPELMFIHLAAHAAYHGCSRLIWLYDLKRVADAFGDSMDWALMSTCAGQWRLSWPVLRAIERATELLGPICPGVVVKELREHPVSWRDRLSLAHAPQDAAAPARHVAVNLLCTPGIRFRAGYLRSVVFAGRGHLADSYPFRHWGWPVCAQLWRVVRIVGRLTRALLGILSPVRRPVGRRTGAVLAD